MNKKLICLLAAGLLCLASAGAQNLSENEYQKKGRDYEKQATEAMATGDYDKAAELANLAAVEYRKSREYADALLLKFRAANAINLAQSTITDLENVSRVKKTYASELAAANALLAEARALYAAESWADSRAKALEAIDALKGIKGVSGTAAAKTAGLTLPRFYVVVSRPVNTDCYWRIAEMPFVFGDPLLWPNLWKANKEKMRDPENPNLIYPGMIIEIPTLGDETREGTYDPTVTYPELTK